MNIFVGCGGSNGNKPEYLKLAYNIGKYIAENDYTLVFGGYDKGLMGSVYRGVVENSSSPKVKSYTLNKWKNNLKVLNSIEEGLAETMNERKEILIKNSDITVILPGGVGTLDELFSQLDMFQTDETTSKIIVYNYNHFYDDLINLYNKLINEGFVNESNGKGLLFANSEEEIYEMLKKFDKNGQL